MNSENTSMSQEARLFSRGQVLLAAVFGGPIGAALAGRKSAIALDEPTVGKRLLIVGIGMLVLLFVVIGLLPTDVPNNPVLAVILFMPVVLLFDSALKGKVKTALDAGVKKHSWWRAVGIGVLGLLISVVALIVLFLLVPLNPINTFEYGNNVIYYEGKASEEDAKRLAIMLEREGVFNPDAVWEMSLFIPEHDGDLFIVKVPFLESVENSETRQMLRALRELLQAHYADKHVEVHATNVFGHVILRVDE